MAVSFRHLAEVNDALIHPHHTHDLHEQYAGDKSLGLLSWARAGNSRKGLQSSWKFCNIAELCPFNDLNLTVAGHVAVQCMCEPRNFVMIEGDHNSERQRTW